MEFGKDYFLIIQFVIGVMRLFARLFGSTKDKNFDDEVQGNCAHEIDKIIPESPKKPKT